MAFQNPEHYGRACESSVGMRHRARSNQDLGIFVCLNAGVQYQQRTNKVSSQASSTGKHTGITLYMNKINIFKG